MWLNAASSSALLAGLFVGGLGFTALFQARRAAHCLFAAGMIVLAAESFFLALAAEALTPAQAVSWLNWRLLASALLPAAWLAFSLVYARGNGREFLARWRWLLLTGAILPVILAAASGFRMIIAVEHEQPQVWIFALTLTGKGLYLLLLISFIAIMVNLERTFRASIGTMRWRIKFMIIGLGVLFTVRLYTSSQALLYGVIDLSLQVLNVWAQLAACLLILRSLWRAGHFEVSVYPSQAVLHNSFTILLAGAYLLIVGLLAKTAALLGGDTHLPLKALLVLVGLIGLTIVLLSDRVRLHTRRFVSRHFHRPIYDYLMVWRTITQGTARRIDQGELCEAIVKLVADIFQSLSVSIWIVDERKENFLFAASTSIFDVKPGQTKIDPAYAQEVIEALAGHSQPIDIDGSNETWAVSLRRLHPELFRKGGNRICVPMISAGEVMGILALGDRVGGVPFTTQDFDVLKSVADQAAASLLNTLMAHRLSQAKQLEAFQAMSAFFVHDLKNTASRLSLMLENFRVHYQDPEFREDALRGISNTIDHINDLISRLSLLRHELGIKPVDSDLNGLVEQTLKTYQDGGSSLQVSSELGSIPAIKMDPDQIEKVLTNLILNAKEAIGSAGQIRVNTNRRNGWAVLEVSDTGCGMTREFINTRLFRPFETTKKKGIGIGMFHCKMIIDAHRGRIEVESEPGKGTIFRVLLPITAQS